MMTLNLTGVDMPGTIGLLCSTIRAICNVSDATYGMKMHVSLETMYPAAVQHDPEKSTYERRVTIATVLQADIASHWPVHIQTELAGIAYHLGHITSQSGDPTQQFFTIYLLMVIWAYSVSVRLYH